MHVNEGHPKMAKVAFTRKCSELQKAIRQFHWIGPAMLGAQIDRSREHVRDLLDQAVNAILQTNAETLPRFVRIQRL